MNFLCLENFRQYSTIVMTIQGHEVIKDSTLLNNFLFEYQFSLESDICLVRIIYVHA